MSNNKDRKPSQQRRGTQRRPTQKPPLPTSKRSPLTYLVIGLVLLTLWTTYRQWHKTDEIWWNEFVKYLSDGHIESVVVKDTEASSTKRASKYEEKRNQARSL
jgi:hypothetical protein